MLEHGAYTLLMDRYYATECGIPADRAYPWARARTEEERAAVDAVLNEFFSLVDGVWVKARIESEIAKANARIEAARANGKTGGRPKKNPDETQQKPNGLCLGSLDLTQTKAYQTPDTRHQVPEDQKIKDSSSKADDQSAKQEHLNGFEHEPKPVLQDKAAKLEAKQRRLAEVTSDAIDSFNAILARPHGMLSAVNLKNEVREKQVRKCITVARQIAERTTGSSVLTRAFWDDFWEAVNEDDFRAGRVPGGKGHENWKPSFKYLMTPEVMSEVFDNASSGGAE